MLSVKFLVLMFFISTISMVQVFICCEELSELRPVLSKWMRSILYVLFGTSAIWATLYLSKTPYPLFYLDLLALAVIEVGFFGVFQFIVRYRKVAVVSEFFRFASLLSWMTVRLAAVIISIFVIGLFWGRKRGPLLRALILLPTLYFIYERRETLGSQISSMGTEYWGLFPALAGLFILSLTYEIRDAFFAQYLRAALNRTVNIGVDKNTGKELWLGWSDMNRHIHIVGQPGCGKSILLRNIYKGAIEAGIGLMVIDLKGDRAVVEEIAGIAQKEGRLDDLQLISLSYPEQSIGYNPLKFGNSTELKDKIIGSLEWSEPYYKKLAESYLLALCSLVAVLRDDNKIECNLHDLVRFIKEPEHAEEALKKCNIINSALKKSLEQKILSLQKEHIKRSLTGLVTDLELLTESDFGSIFSTKKSLDLIETARAGKILVCSLDGQTYGSSAARLARILVGDLRSLSGSRVAKLEQSDNKEFLVSIDEFSDIVGDEQAGRQFSGLLNRCRGSNIGVVLAHQSFGDFKDPLIGKQILDSTETLFAFNQKDPDTCELLASVAGTILTDSYTYQVDETLFSSEKTGLASKREVHEFIYHPNSFRNLNIGEAIYLAKKPSAHGEIAVKMLEVTPYNPMVLPEKIPSEEPVAVENSPPLEIKGEIESASNKRDLYDGVPKDFEI